MTSSPPDGVDVLTPSPRGRRGVGAVVLGVAIVVGLALALAVVVLNRVAGSDDADAASDSTSHLQVIDLEVGGCFDHRVLFEADPAEVGGMTLLGADEVPCDEAHQFEVYHSFDLPDVPEYPGPVEVDQQAWDGCTDALDEFLGESWEDTSLEFYYFPPGVTNWYADETTVACVVYEPGFATTGTLRSSAG